ncbi:MAG: hypothetical protein ACRD3V_27470 [Vicinamibacteria bacterium]
MRSIALVLLSLLLLVAIRSVGGALGLADDDRDDLDHRFRRDHRQHVVEMLDNCDPTDPGYDPTGGCSLSRRKGDVTLAEFFELLFTPLDPGGDTILIGHPSWRNEPSYLSIEEHRRVRVRNRGGRTHTFTEVEDFGGGFIPDLNGGLETAPECDPTTATMVPPGGRTHVTGLAPGLHRFQCCIHPWMRAAIRVD